MKLLPYKKIRALILMLVCFTELSGQTCSHCDVHYSASTSMDIFVSSGTVCIESGVVISGNVFMQGGVLCNHGQINKLILNDGAGEVHNTGTMICNEEHINIHQQIIINNYSGGEITFPPTDMGELNITLMGQGELFFRLYNESVTSIESGLNISEGYASFETGLIWSDDDTNMADATLNLKDASFNYCRVDITTYSTGIVNLNGSLNMNNSGVKSIVNDGVMNIYNGLNIGGDGGSDNVSVINNLILNVNADALVNIIESNIVIQNTGDGSPDVVINVDGDCILSSTTCTVINNAFVNVSGTVEKTGGVLYNTGVLAADVLLKHSGGTMYNGNFVVCGSMNNVSAATFTNNSNLICSNNFSNSGQTILEKESQIRCGNYYNTTGGNIVGPVLDAVEAANNKHAVINIYGESINTGTISGGILVVDRDLNCSTGTSGFGFDQVNAGTATGIEFGHYCEDDNWQLDCNSNAYFIRDLASDYMEICPKDSLRTLRGDFGYAVCYFPVGVEFYPVTAGVTFSWSPGSFPQGTLINVSPSVTTVYSLTVNYKNCTYVKTFSVVVKDDCPEEIIGCCFSNYGAAVWLNDPVTHINIYCNLVNELGVTGTQIQQGEWESYYGKVRVDLDWIHNAKNSLYNAGLLSTTYGGQTFHPVGIKNGESALIGKAQNIRGNSVTDFNHLMLQGSGTKTMKVSANSTGNLHLYDNVLSVGNHTYAMKNANTWARRHTGYASTEDAGYFSHVLGNAAQVANQAYLYPLGAPATATSSYRYRPLVMANNSTTQSDEISANFSNKSPAASNAAFTHTNSQLTNTVTAQAPNVLLVNQKYYHKIKNTVKPTNPSDVTIKSYYTTIEGPYQSLAEWERDPTQTHDWWGSTPGAAGSTVVSPDSITKALLYAQANGTLSFNHEPFALSKGGFYINTSNFGTGGGNSSGGVITVTAQTGGGGTTPPQGGGLSSPYGTGSNSGNSGNGGSTVFSPNPVNGDYIITVSPSNNCGVPSKIKFTVEQDGTIDPSSVQYGLTTDNGYLGQLSPEVFTIDNVNTGLILTSSPKDLLTACVNTISIASSNGDYVVDKGTEVLEVRLPTVVGPNTITYGNFNLYNAAGTLVSSFSSLAPGAPANTFNLSTYNDGVYRFEMLVSVSTSPPITEMVKGQIIVKP